MDRTDRRRRAPLHSLADQLRKPSGDRGTRRRPLANPSARLRDRRTDRYISFKEASYVAGLGNNPGVQG